jgi:putative Mn2+ efflux pump MntP
VLTLLLVGASVGLGNFAASIAIGLSGVDRQVRVRIAVVFGIFEAGMPVIGLLVGRGLSGSLGAQAHIVGGGLLILAGVQMAVSAIRSGDDEPAALAGAPLGRLLVLAAGLSIDNLVIGFALGARNSPLILAVVVIGVVSVAMSLAGLELGSRLGGRVEHWSELLGAGVLSLVGLAIITRVL